MSINIKTYDVIVAGGSLGGVMTAYSLCKNGHKVLLIEETKWIGGQLTSQGVPSDEHQMIEKTGATKTYREYRNRVRNYYRNHPSIIDELKTKEIFNPGNGWVSKNSHDPRLALKLLNDMLDPFVKNGRLEIILNAKVIGAETIDHEIKNVTIETKDTIFTAKASYVVDATDTGELLPITQTKYVTGAEAFSEYQEPHAPEKALPKDMQPITWTAAVGFMEDGKDHTIDKPELYEYFKNYIMPFGESVLSWYAAGLDHGTKRLFSMFATPNTKFSETPAMFTYRQVIEKNYFKDNYEPASVMLINWPQNDYIMGNIFDDPNSEMHKYRAKQLTLSLVYWLQTEAKRCDGKGFGYKEVKLMPEVLGTDDGLALAPYIRESRRIKALYTIKEQDINKRYAKEPKFFWDTVGVGHYHIDLHMTTETKTYFFDETWPFQIPLGALIPVETKNLIAACKNIGTTHVTNGCYRLHPVEWNIGESAGHFISFCLEKNLLPKDIYQSKELVKEFQQKLESEGVMLSWPDDVYIDESKYIVKGY